MAEPACPPIVLVTGPSDSGKTTLVTELVRALTRRGLEVGTIKHASHRLDLDMEGKDTARHQAAGARATVALSPDRLFHVERLDPAGPPPALEAVAARFLPRVDLIIAEGFKVSPLPRIEVVPAGEGQGETGPGRSDAVLGVVRGRREGDAIRFEGEVIDRLVRSLLGSVRPARARSPR